ncbi:MAG: hypothetical protein AAGM04_13830 [Pseudomonadota bacterium]
MTGSFGVAPDIGAGEPAKQAGALTIVCSDCPRNGKTLFAKLACDMIALRRGEPPLIYDTDEPVGGLLQHFPGAGQVVDLAKTPEQVAVIDGMLSADNGAFLLDLEDRHFRPFFSMCNEIAFEHGAATVGLDVTVYFVVDRLVRSVEALLELNSTFRDWRIVPVLNNGIGHAADNPTIVADYTRANFRREILLPDLSPEALAMVEHPDFHFDQFVAGRYEHFPFELKVELWDFLETLYHQRDLAEEKPSRPA